MAYWFEHIYGLQGDGPTGYDRSGMGESMGYGCGGPADASATTILVIVPYEPPKDATSFVGEGLTSAHEWVPMDATCG